MNSMSTVSANMCSISKGVYQKLREKMEVLTPKGVYRELLGMHLEEEHCGKMQENFLWMIMFCGTRM